MKDPTKRKAFSTCTLKELCPADKQKVAKLVKQVVDLGQDNQRLKDAAEQAAAAAEEKIKQIQECNKEAVKENCSLKNKLGQAVTVLRMYHHKVQGLDAALRAVHTATSANNAATGHQPNVPSRQELHDLGAQNVAEDNAAAEDDSNLSQRGAKQQQQQQAAATEHTFAGAGLAPSGSSPSLSAAAAASRLHQQARQLSAVISKHMSAANMATAPPAVPPCAVAVWADAAPASCCGATIAATTAAPERCPPACSAAADTQSALTAGEDGRLLPVTPLVLPPTCSVGAREALRDLAHWQLQQGLITPGQVDATFEKVLQFDPSVGSHGAFMVREVPDITAAAAAAAAVGDVECAYARNTLMYDNSKSSIQPGTYKSEQYPWAVPAAPTPGLANAALLLNAGNGSTRAAAVSAPINCTLDCQPSSTDGLREASPWDSPTNQQLRSLAAAFDSLAVLSPRSAAVRTSTSAAAQASSPAAADVLSVAVLRSLPFGPGSLAAGACRANDTMSDKASLEAEQSVEEVPVESSDARQAPVMVYNEKSRSSFHAPPSTAAANPWEQPQQQPTVMGFSKYSQQQHPGQPLLQQGLAGQRQHKHQNTAVWQQHLHQQQQQQYGALQQQHWPSQTALLVSQPKQQWTAQQETALQQVQPLFHTATSLQQQHECQVQEPLMDLHGLQHVAHQQENQQWQQAQALLQHSVPLALQGQQQAHHAACATTGVQPQVQPSAAQSVQPQQPTFSDITEHCSASSVPQHHAAQHAGLADQAGTGGVLQRFDESLVDLLLEVERLEQQQQFCKSQLQQEQQQEDQHRQRRTMKHQQPLHPQECPEWQPPAAQPCLFANKPPLVVAPQQFSAGHTGGMQLGIPSQQSTRWRLDQQWRGGRIAAHHGLVHCKQQVSTLSLQEYHHLGACCADDDVVSDILNHLDEV